MSWWGWIWGFIFSILNCTSQYIRNSVIRHQQKRIPSVFNFGRKSPVQCKMFQNWKEYWTYRENTEKKTIQWFFFSFLKKAYGSIEAHHALCRRRKEETTNKKKMKPSEKDSKSRERNAMLFYVKRMRKMHCSKQ